MELLVGVLEDWVSRSQKMLVACLVAFVSVSLLAIPRYPKLF